ncbi:MAG: DUF4093 domain-containing protein [Clostridia bacterium]|nr:DUF4093 domain-containing protein [Clostridia bacterium]
MIRLKQAVVVEGKYDAIRLANVIDALIIRTDGFGIFKDKEKQQLLRRLAQERGLILLTDSDSAGFLIRNFIANCVPASQCVQVYIPDIYGKEKRKTAPSAEGKLGVEGVKEDILLEAFRKAGVTATQTDAPRDPITNIDLYEHGLSGTPHSRENRKRLLQKLALPERLSTGALVKVLNCFVTRDEFLKIAKELGL